MLRLLEPADNSGILPICYFHALARLGQEGLILIEPAQSFVSLGLFDDTDTVLDRDFCARHGVPVMRRETGGGMVLLGPGQIFYTLVVKRPSRFVPSQVDSAYRYLSQAPISTYAQFGVKATLRPINDIITKQGRKIAGQGAADMNGHFCFVGSILIDFDTDLMHKVVKLPDQSLRAPLKEALNAHVTSIYRETGTRPSAEAVKRALAAAFAPLLGGLRSEDPTPSLMAETQAVAAELTSEEALASEDRRPRRLFKVREGLYLCQRAWSAQGRAHTLSLTIHDEHIETGSLKTDNGENATHTDLRGLSGTRFARGDVARALATLAPMNVTTDEILAQVFGNQA